MPEIRFTEEELKALNWMSMAQLRKVRKGELNGSLPKLSPELCGFRSSTTCEDAR